MKICIDISPAVHRRAGLGRMAYELATALFEAAPEHDYSVFYNQPSHADVTSPLDSVSQRTIDLGNKRWRLHVLQAYALRQAQDQLIGPTDIFHATDHLLPHLQHTRTVFSLGDVTYLSHPQTHSRLNRMFLRLMMPRFLSSADAIIAISQNTLSEMQRYYGLNLSNSAVVYLGVNKRFRPVTDMDALADVRIRYDLPPNFLLYVGTTEPRKNLSRLIEAYARIHPRNVKLVIAGKKGWLYEETFSLVESLGLHEDVIFPGYVDDADLPALYSAAHCFLFPSLYEGFGLPVPEAMACGTPVITSNTSSLLEVAGDAAILINPNNIDDMRDAIQAVMANPSMHADMRKKGLENASRFTWERTANQTLEIYQQLAAS